MLQRFEIQGVHINIDDNLQKYITRKIGRLDRYMSRQCREAAHMEVHLKESKIKDSKHCSCEVTLHMPQQNIIIKESALNMYAAVDIVEAKLKQQLQKYKDKHHSGKNRRHLFGRFTRQNAF
jgi:putative sigma-54 modulation protein